LPHIPKVEEARFILTSEIKSHNLWTTERGGESAMNKLMLFMVFAAVCLGRLGPSDETCCPSRDIAVIPPQVPEGHGQDLSIYYAGAVQNPLDKDALESTDCPEINIVNLENAATMQNINQNIDAALQKQKGLPPDKVTLPPPENNMDYVFRGSLTEDQVTGKDLPGNLEGKFTFRLELVDHHHSNTVVKEGFVSWTGDILHGVEAVESLAGSFRPLPPLLNGYERIPENAHINVPNDKVEAGHIETITFSELFDKDGRQTQWWQRLFVHIEKGKILNAEQIVEHKGKQYYIFRANEGTVKIKYQAPDECKNDRETLTIYNCCEKKEPPSFMTLRPRKEIAKKEFNIVCNRWNVELTFNKSVGGKEEMGTGLTRELGWTYSATVKAIVEFVKSSGSDLIYESKSSDLDFTDNFWQHIVLKTEDHTCEGRLSWTGTHNGSIQVPVRMIIHSRANRCSFGFGSRKEADPIIFKMGINLWGDEKCGGPKAWQGQSEVKDVMFDASGTDFPDHIPKPIAFKPGQKEVVGEDQWNSKTWLRFYEVKIPIDPSQFPVQSRPLLALLRVTPMMSEKISANATLTWKATKLGQKD
jgi:hypothetical protein